MTRYVLCRVEKIHQEQNGNISISSSDGNVTRAFKQPLQGLHLRMGDFIIRHEVGGNTVAIDRLIRIDDFGRLRLKRVLGLLKDVPSLKGKNIELCVSCR